MTMYGSDGSWLHASVHVSTIQERVLSAGVQLARMTPFRAWVAVIGAALATIAARQLQLNNGMRTYISV